MTLVSVIVAIKEVVFTILYFIAQMTKGISILPMGHTGQVSGNISCRYSIEPPQCDGSLGHQQHIHVLRPLDKKVTLKNLLIWTYP